MIPVIALITNPDMFGLVSGYTHSGQFSQQLFTHACNRDAAIWIDRSMKEAAETARLLGSRNCS